MMKRTVIQVVGIRRSGNHAIITWLQSLYGKTVHYNNLPHVFFTREDEVERVKVDVESDCVICSFEDFPGFRKPDLSLKNSVDLVDPAMIDPDRNYFVFYIIRDVYNLFASMLKSGMINDHDDVRQFIDDWLSVARQYDIAPEQCILYNEWFSNAQYRRTICDHLGQPYREETLSELAREGKGSSFDGLPRPSAKEIARNLPKYLSASFARRLARNPMSYVNRILAKPIDARELDVKNRWKYLSERDEHVLLMQAEEVHALNARLFGFRLNEHLEMVA